MLVPEPAVVAHRYYELFNARKLEEAERLVSPQAVFRYPHSREHLIGRAGYRELVRLWLQAFPDGVAEVLAARAVGDDAVVVDILGRGTHSGPLAFGGLLTLPASGLSAQMRFSDTLKIEHGLIVESTVRFEIKEMLHRLGG
jgi:hypothetical protein